MPSTEIQKSDVTDKVTVISSLVDGVICQISRSGTVRRRRFGGKPFRRWWSQMFYAKKMCVFEIL